MKEDREPWHELTYVCPNCCKEFKPEAAGRHVRLCSGCEWKKRHDSLMKQAANPATGGRTTTNALLEGVLGN